MHGGSGFLAGIEEDPIMSAYWIVVANASRVRIFEAEAHDSGMREIIDMAHPASRLREGELVSDRGGHVMHGTTGGHGVYRAEAARQHEAEVFAREVCERLEQGRVEGSYRKLYIVAAPQFLGLLRRYMRRPLHDMVREEIAKDLTVADPGQIHTQVF